MTNSMVHLSDNVVILHMCGVYSMVDQSDVVLLGININVSYLPRITFKIKELMCI